jgi:hypothetical protein
LIIAFVGFGVMVAAYTGRDQIDHTAPWASGFMVLSREPLVEKSASVGAIPARLRLLPSSDIAEMMLFGTGDLAGDKAIGVKSQVRVKLIELPLSDAGITAAELQSGRLPQAGQGEILAGANIGPSENLKVGGQTLKVVGVLKPSVTLFADSFLVPRDQATDRLFPDAVPSVLHAALVRATAEERRDAGARKRLEDAFPPEKFVWVNTIERLEPRTFYLYISGLAVFLLGGTGALIGLFRWLAGRVTSPFLAAPLWEMKARPRLVWGVHLVFFGLVIVGSLLIHRAPEAQFILLGKVREALATKSNPLGVAGEAYLSGNIPRAAATTLMINFLLGSLAVITLPSILLPGSGILVAVIRAFVWGVILAPILLTLALAMLPHSVTLLLEGEGYILAALFGLLIPFYIVRPGLGGNPLSRFGRVLSLNLKAQVWIALVLAVAAIYEATEVIWMNR